MYGKKINVDIQRWSTNEPVVDVGGLEADPIQDEELVKVEANGLDEGHVMNSQLPSSADESSNRQLPKRFAPNTGVSASQPTAASR